MQKPEDPGCPQSPDPVLGLVLEMLACPACYGGLQPALDALACRGCHRVYPIMDGIPILLIDRARMREGGGP
ncbi:MAG TPA: Trm112 family protein [Acidobacteriaceae bacterium]